MGLAIETQQIILDLTTREAAENLLENTPNRRSFFFDRDGHEIQLDRSAVIIDRMGCPDIRWHQMPFALINLEIHPWRKSVYLSNMHVMHSRERITAEAFHRIFLNLRRKIRGFREEGYDVVTHTWLFAKYPKTGKVLGFRLSGFFAKRREMRIKKILSEGGTLPPPGIKNQFPKYVAKRIPGRR